jgi:6-phosphofructokinase 1
MVMAEGAGNPLALSEHLADVTGHEIRVSSLGYIQRGGSPTANSIKLASLFGNRAVELLLEKSGSKMIGMRNEKLVTCPLNYPARHRKKISDKLYKLAQILST